MFPTLSHMICDNFSSCPTHIREHCYKTLVRSQLEYASAVWDNNVKSNINKVESVQRNAAHFTCSDSRRTSSVTAMLRKLQWHSLQQRRARSRVLMLYQIRNGLVAIPAAAYLEPVPICTTEGSKQDMYRFSALQAHSQQSDLLSKCNPAVEHSASRHLPAMSWQFQDPSQQFPFHLSSGLHPAFYSAMLCMRGTSHGPVSVCVCHKSVLKRLNTGSHKQNHMIAKFDFCFLIPKISAKFDRGHPLRDAKYRRGG